MIPIILKFRVEKILCSFLSCMHQISFEGHKILHTRKRLYLCLHDLVHEKVSRKACFFTVVHACTKSLSKAYKIIMHQNSRCFQPLNYLHFNLVFIDNKAGQEFRNILLRKLCNCFLQWLLPSKHLLVFKTCLQDVFNMSSA